MKFKQIFTVWKYSLLVINIIENIKNFRQFHHSTSWFITACSVEITKLKMNFVDIFKIESVKAINRMKDSREKEVCMFYPLIAARFHLCSLKTGKQISGSASFLSFYRVLCSSIRLLSILFVELCSLHQRSHVSALEEKFLI